MGKAYPWMIWNWLFQSIWEIPQEAKQPNITTRWAHNRYRSYFTPFFMAENTWVRGPILHGVSGHHMGVSKNMENPPNHQF